MARRHGTDRNGNDFDEYTKREVWKKATLDKPAGLMGNETRIDVCGAPMEFLNHGDTDKPTGWEIDHIQPLAKGGSDEISNLRPLQWENNRTKSDKWPEAWSCARGNELYGG